MIFSILYVNYKSSSLVRDSIISFLDYHKDFFENGEIIVVDNCSGDDLSELHVLNKNIKLVYNNKNSGFGAGNNLAFKHATGKFILLVNPDIVFRENITNKISDYYDSSVSNKTDIVGVRILDSSGKQGPSYGKFPSLVKECFWFLDRGNEINKVISENIFTVDVVSGAFCCIPYDVYCELCGFDEDFFLYFEETDLQYRHYKAGGRSVILNELTVTHYESQITGMVPDAKLLNIAKGRFTYHRKNSPKIIARLVRVNRFGISFFAYLLGRGDVHRKLMKYWWSPK